MIDICLVGASGKMGKAVISASTNDDKVNINNFIVSEESRSLNKNVGEFHFGNINEWKFESYPSKDFDLIIDFATRDGIEKRIEIYKAFKKPVRPSSFDYLRLRPRHLAKERIILMLNKILISRNPTPGFFTRPDAGIEMMGL